MTLVFILLVVYQIKHFVADYPLQGKYMLGKFKGGNEWILPLLAHVGVHGAFTFLIALMVKPELAGQLALFDMAVHFIMDRIKASPNLLGRFKPLSAEEYKKYVFQKETYTGASKIEGTKEFAKIAFLDEIKNIDKKFKHNSYFWYSLGLDQMVHHLTHYAIIWWLVS